MQITHLTQPWTLTCDSKPLTFATTLPMEVHQTLLQAGEIKHPYNGLNEADVQWVAKQTWNLETEFELEQQQLDSDELYLELAEVDTVADIYLNGSILAELRNQFQTHRLNLKELGILGRNQLKITLKPAHTEAQRRADNLPFPIPFSAGNNNKIPHMNTLRKTQCHAGWDWGICLMITGIYQRPAICAIRKTNIKHVAISQSLQENELTLNLDIQLRNYQDVNESLRIQVGDLETALPVILPKGDHSVTQLLTIKNPDLWWPNGYGEQNLTTMSISIADSQWTKQIGFRDIKVKTEPDNIGTGLVVNVNGKDIFCKGANWIPADALTLESTELRYRHLLTDAADAHMNMIRVWGGGMYEREAFYQLCDELGLLVWQDLMFACSLYPSTDEFLTDVGIEIEHQVKRLAHHACLALWCGDNEVIGALNWYPESRDNRERYIVNYDRLSRSLAQHIEKHDPSRRFWPSSPCNGDLDYGDAWHDDASGDMHFWDVWHSSKSFEAYYDVQPRFCSEFGFQSFPSIQTVRGFADDDQLNLTSPVMESHQKNMRGNSIITEMLTRYFRFPDGFENTLYLSQVQQAVAIKLAVEYWRSLRPICMGALYWQLNDNWPVASWSSLEHNGKWKQLHYHAKRFFAPVLVTFSPTSDNAHWQLIGINDGLKEAPLQGRLVRYDLHGNSLESRHIKCLLASESANVLLSIPTTNLNQNASTSFWRFESADGQLENSFYFAPWKRMSIPKAQITYEVSEDDSGISIIMGTDQPAHFVTIDLNTKEPIHGHFSDNSFTLMPGQPKKIAWLGNQLPITTIQEQLTIHHLRSSYS